MVDGFLCSLTFSRPGLLMVDLLQTSICIENDYDL